ncbi:MULTISPECIES: hypothetical protein [Psychrobacter]|jgi:hypothetical protein|uniref:hypothetical protein n=1 Tax=Psychrobacter TaxID=497 RepID=UPI0019183F93|nr:hypothetical protein [Psychrobacter immobilis]
MFTKFLALCGLLAFSVPCFPEVVQVNTSEPPSMSLGTVIDMSDMESVQEIILGKGTLLLARPLIASAKILRDAETGMNHYTALIAYDLSTEGVKELEARLLYFQCPISRHTYVDRSVPYYEVLDGKKVIVGSAVKIDTVAREFLSPGYYRFLPLPKDEKFALDASFPMAGEMNPPPDIEIMCAQIEIAHLKHLQSELNRNAILKEFGVSE